MQAYIAFPELNKINAFLKVQSNLPFSYSEIGRSKTDFVAGFDNDYNKIFLGTGNAVWENAKKALQTWQQFPENWTKIHPNTALLKKGETVAVLFHLFGIWWLNSAKIVYTLADENRFGFAYGTLPGHVECGEECFWITKENDGRIYYHIRAFSRPRFWMAKIGYPLARWHQRKFVRQSMQRMYQLANQKNVAHV